MTTKEVQKAGAIILSKNDNKKIALLYRGKQKDWSFPKGHTEDGENPTETMTREIKEETGLSVVILRELPDLQYTHPDGSSISTKMFLVNSTDDGTLKTEHESDSIEWVPIDNVSSRLSYNNLKEYFEKVSEVIQHEK